MMHAPRHEEEPFIRHMRAVLVARRVQQTSLAETLQGEVAELVQQDSAVETRLEEGYGQGAGTSLERDLRQRLRAQALETVAAIDAALARMDAGTYGVCARCGQSIGLERLEVVPTAEVCVGCKARQVGGGLRLSSRR